MGRLRVGCKRALDGERVQVVHTVAGRAARNARIVAAAAGCSAFAMLTAVPASFGAPASKLAGATRAAVPHSPHNSPTPVASLSAAPATLALAGPRAIARVQVTAALANGDLRDVSASATPEITPPTIARCDSDGTLRPLHDGAATITYRYAGHSTRIHLTVRDSAKRVPIGFSNEVVPALTRLGCNQGACHGAQYGKGGFKLSLSGFDPDVDYAAIVKLARGRRVSFADPERSLVLLKPTMSVPHGGGRRLEPGSADYRLLLQWLRDGAPGPKPDDPVVTRLEVLPAERVMWRESGPLQLVVRATYSDGAVRDVTDHARVNSLNDAIAGCTPDGVVTATGKGQTAIMVRYAGQATVCTVMAPYARGTVQAARAKPPDSFIDKLVERKQRQLGLAPSPICDDRAFIRRVSFDLIGTAPKSAEVKAFLADHTPDKRAKLVDALLARPEYADYWTLKWGDLLRSNRSSLGQKGMWSLTNWIHGQMHANRPADQFVHDLILAQGSTYTNGPANYYRVAGDAQDRAETTSQVFLGVRLQCARCHHHPFEKWSQADYYQFAAFFARVEVKGSEDFGVFGNEQVVKIADSGEVNHPKTGAVMHPTPLGVKLASLPGGKAPDPDADGDRRQALADWLVSKQNRLFARNIANRYWGYLLSKGIVNPIDDQRVTNPPTNPELLGALADDFVRSGFDLKHLLRTICMSRTYQRSSEATPLNKSDELFFTHYLPKRLPAETLLDAVDFACKTQEKFPELPQGTRAIQLPDPQVGSDFLDVFGRPQRLTDCECERTAEPNLSQTLRLMNGELVNRKVADGNNRIAELINQKKTNSDILDSLYTATLCRPPNRVERARVLSVLAFADDRRPVFEDVLLTLLNSKEFLFNH